MRSKRACPPHRVPSPRRASPRRRLTAAVEILPPDEPWAGLTRGEWDARWWQWAVSMPEEINPNFDTSGERCGYGQSGPVFFLPGNVVGEGPAEITCVVAAGTAIYVNVVGSECSTVEAPPYFGRTEDELRACANATLDEVPEYSGSHQRAGRRRPGRLSDRVTAVHAHLRRGQHLRGGAGCGAVGVGGLQLDHRPAAAWGIRDRHVGEVRGSPECHHGHRHRRSTPGDRRQRRRVRRFGVLILLLLRSRTATSVRTGRSSRAATVPAPTAASSRSGSARPIRPRSCCSSKVAAPASTPSRATDAE